MRSPHFNQHARAYVAATSLVVISASTGSAQDTCQGWKDEYAAVEGEIRKLQEVERILADGQKEWEALHAQHSKETLWAEGGLASARLIKRLNDRAAGEFGPYFGMTLGLVTDNIESITEMYVNQGDASLVDSAWAAVRADLTFACGLAVDQFGAPGRRSVGREACTEAKSAYDSFGALLAKPTRKEDAIIHASELAYAFAEMSKKVANAAGRTIRPATNKALEKFFAVWSIVNDVTATANDYQQAFGEMNRVAGQKSPLVARGLDVKNKLLAMERRLQQVSMEVTAKCAPDDPLVKRIRASNPWENPTESPAPQPSPAPSPKATAAPGSKTTPCPKGVFTLCGALPGPTPKKRNP